MAASAMASLALKPSRSPFLDRSRFPDVKSSARASAFKVMAKKAKKIQTSQPCGPAGGLNLKDGVDASARPAKGKGVYQFASKYGANVDGYRGTYWTRVWAVLSNEEEKIDLKKNCSRLEDIALEFFNKYGWNFRRRILQ